MATKSLPKGKFFSVALLLKNLLPRRGFQVSYIYRITWLCYYRISFHSVFQRECVTFVPAALGNMLGFPLKLAKNGFSSSEVDGIVYVSSQLPINIDVTEVIAVLKAHADIDESFSSDISVHPVKLPAGRLVYSPVSNLTDYDDVRSFAEAASKGIKRALKAGIKDPLLYLPRHDKFPNCQLVTLLGALEALYVPIQVREDVPEKKCKVRSLSVYSENEAVLPELLKTAEILECGRIICRDIGSGDPERMAAPRIEEYVREVFKDSCIDINVISDPKVFEKEYPLFAVVNRAANVIERHRGRIIYLKYEPKGEIKRTLGIIGKGITYDTGGADIKIGGAMSGMSRDKCGAAAVAGFLKIVSQFKPEGVRIIGAMCVARNSVGENSYVSDEVVTARSKARVRVTNTDAEGRMVMADVLCKVKEDLLQYPNAHLVTIATLTGHACRSVGPYSIILDNSVARQKGHCFKLQEAGMAMGDPFEISTLRREDFSCYKGSWEGDDVSQTNKEASRKTERGHQGPGAFLIMASGLDKHGLTSTIPLSYSHLDIAGSCGSPPHEPTAATILGLYSAYIKN